MADPLQITVNGELRTTEGLPPRVNLLDWLRSLGLTGAKEGCAEGECGACAVLVARPDGPERSRWTSVNACLPPASSFDGQEVVTAEGLGTAGAPGVSEDLHPVQREMAERGGSQCGYCTPGFICSMAAEYYRPERAPREDGADAHCGANGFDLHALSGNLCRCTGYRPIRDAAYELGEPEGEDPLRRRLGRGAPEPRPITVRSEESAFSRPRTFEELLRAYAEETDALLMAGATDLGVESNIRHLRPRLVLAIDHLSELRELSFSDDVVRIGSGVTLSEVERLLDGRVPLLAQLMPLFASRLIRNSATLGGNLGTASPIGDAAPVLLALDASLVLASAEGERTVRLSEFFTGYRETVMAPGELIRAVEVPMSQLPTTAFYKIAKRRFDDISGVAVAIAADVEDGTFREVRIGLGGVAATPIRASATEDALRGRPWTAETIADAAAVMAGEGTPMDDLRASARYRSAMLEESLPRFFAEFAAVEVEGASR
ncbi:xanthine dehydrogenase small subunit [Nesterenkonia marinintestina]|uniref:xanthine dehydrogenase small subunit n=1 Tax=Nesterenkonia marinintestina TaxID=2979865 RepID=UPI0021BED586|nr:FAD binding domain-containing protein [Nesterenkonia sp. GX14115]